MHWEYLSCVSAKACPLLPIKAYPDIPINTASIAAFMNFLLRPDRFLNAQKTVAKIHRVAPLNKEKTKKNGGQGRRLKYWYINFLFFARKTQSCQAQSH